MSDKISAQSHKENRNSIFSKIIALLVVITLVICVLAVIMFPGELNIDAIRRWFRYLSVRGNDTYGEYRFDAHNSNAYAALGDGLALASVGGLYGFDAYGNNLTVAQAQMALPVLEAEGGYAIAYDVSGSSLLEIHEQQGEVLRITNPQFIYDADLAADGAVCYASSTEGHKTVLTVYNEKQKLIYRWLSSSAYMPVCAVSEGAQYLAAISLGQLDGSFDSSVTVFKTDKDSPVQHISLGNTMIYDLLFVTQDRLCAIGENEAFFVRTDGTIDGSYSYNGQYLKEFEGGGNGFLTLLLNMYNAGNRNSIVSVDEATGQEIASLYLGQDVLDLSAAGRYVAVLTNESLTVYDQNLQVYAQTVDTGTATAVAMRADGTALLLGNGEGKLYIP